MKNSSQPKKLLAFAILLSITTGSLIYQLSKEQIQNELIQTSTFTSFDAPDLKVGLDLISTSPLTVSAEITNIGQAPIIKSNILHYTLEVEGQTVLNNQDTFTNLDAGDSINFIYEIPSEVYSYPENGTITFQVDPDNQIIEEEELNNKIEIFY